MYHRSIQGFSLDISKVGDKINLEVTCQQTKTISKCQLNFSILPERVKFYYQSIQNLLENLQKQKNVNINNQNIMLPYTLIRLEQHIKGEFIFPLEIKYHQEICQIPKISQNESEKLIYKLEKQLEFQKKMIDNLERRSNIFYFNPGQFLPLRLQQGNNQLYKIRNNYLTRKHEPNHEHSQMLRYSLVSTFPIDIYNHKLFTYKIQAIDVKKNSQILLVFAFRHHQFNRIIGAVDHINWQITLRILILNLSFLNNRRFAKSDHLNFPNEKILFAKFTRINHAPLVLIIGEILISWETTSNRLNIP